MNYSTWSFKPLISSSYQHILFIDASSSDSLQKGLISRVRSMNVGRPPRTVEEALEILSDPDKEYDKDWFIIFDNADDPTTPVSNYIPPCDHGSVLITTRNPALGNLAPDAHLELQNMEEDEAVEVLLSSALSNMMNQSLSCSSSGLERISRASSTVLGGRPTFIDRTREISPFCKLLVELASTKRICW